MSLMMPDGKSWTTGFGGGQPFAPQTSKTFKPTSSANTQRNDQQWGQGNWATSTAPAKVGGDFSAYAPGQAQPRQPQAQGSPYGMQPPATAQGYPQYTNPYAPQGGFSAEYFDLQGNPVSMQQRNAQRDAMVLQLQQANLPYVFANSLNQNVGPPQFDMNTLLQNANKAVDNGFYNPFQRYFEEQDAAQRLAQYAPPSMYPRGGAGPMPDAGNAYPPAANAPTFGGEELDVYLGPMGTPQRDAWESAMTQQRQRQQAEDAMVAPGAPEPPPLRDGGRRYSRWLANNPQAQAVRPPAPTPMPNDLTIDPRYTPPASPSGRYTPVAPRDDGRVRDMRPQYENASRFIQELTRTNPATWTETQWADYERAQRDTGIMDGEYYYRDQQGNVRYGGGYGPAGRPEGPIIGRDSRQDQYGTWGGPSGGSYSPPGPGQFPILIAPNKPEPKGEWTQPGQAQPIQTRPQGEPYPSQPKAQTPWEKYDAQMKTEDERYRKMQEASARARAKAEADRRNREADRSFAEFDAVTMQQVQKRDRFGRPAGWEWKPTRGNIRLPGVPRGSNVQYKPRTADGYADYKLREMQNHYATPEGRAHYDNMARLMTGRR